MCVCGKQCLICFICGSCQSLSYSHLGFLYNETHRKHPDRLGVLEFSVAVFLGIVVAPAGLVGPLPAILLFIIIFFGAVVRAAL